MLSKTHDEEDELRMLIDAVGSQDKDMHDAAMVRAIKLLLQERRDRALVFGWVRLVARYALAVAAGSLIFQQFSNQIREWLQAWTGNIK